MNVSPNCDCWAVNDVAIVPDIGMAASFDPVALDQACVDMVNKATASHGSELDHKDFREGHDKLSHIHPDTNWKVGLDHAKAIGIGTDEYELVIVK